MNSELDIIGIGLANIDVVADFDPNNAALAKMPWAKGEYMSLDAADFETLLSSIRPCGIFPGSSVANSIRDLAAMGISAGFCGAIGGDSYGKMFEDNLTGMGIAPLVQITPDQSSRVCIVMIHADGERTMFSQRGKMNRLDDGTIRALPKSNYVMVEGYMAFKNPNVMDMIKATPAKVAMTLSSMSKAKVDRPWFAEALPRVHALFCNAAEFDMIDFSGLKMPEICVKTLGADGCDVWANGTWRHYAPVPLTAADIVNTNGAGDAFAAGFIYGMIKKYPLDKIVDTANAVAARVLGSEMSHIVNEQ